MVKAGILVKFKIIRVEAEIRPEEAKKRLAERQEAAILEREQMSWKLLEKFKEVRDLRALDGERIFGVAFCVNIDACDDFVQKATELGISCEIVTSREAQLELKKQKKDRQNIVKHAEKRLIEGEIDLMVTVDMVTEGWNRREPNAAIINRISHSAARTLQGPGRIARAFSGKKFGYVFEGNWQIGGSGSRKKS
jgi:superfamily II DNA or RNA helicase